MDIKLSIIIPTYNRPNYILRLINFFISYNIPIKLIILDSSEKEFEINQFSAIIKKNNIIYKKFPSNIFVAHKIGIGSSYITTDYCVICADDDFLLPSSLFNCIDFLEKNLDYSSSHGLYFNHSSYEKTLKNGFRLYPLYIGGKSISDKNASHRLKRYLNGESKCIPYFAVHRTRDFKTIWKKTHYSVDNYGLSEIFPCCMSLILGKMKVLPIFYSSREMNNPKEYFSDDQYSSFFSESRVYKASNALSDFLIQNENISLINSQDFFNKYFFEHGKNKKIYKKNRKHKIIIEIFQKNFLNKIKNKILEYLFYFKYIHYRKDLTKLKSSILSGQAGENELSVSRKDYWIK